MPIARGATRPQPDDIVSTIGEELERHALTWEDVRPLLEQAFPASGQSANDRSRLISAADAVIRRKEVPHDRRAFKWLVDLLSDILDLNVDSKVFDGWFTRTGRALSLTFSVFLLAFTAYMVLGGIISLETQVAKDYGPLATILLLGVLTFALAALEGLQISVTTLRLKDLERLQRQFPHAYRAHKKFRTEEGTRRFLAGRQLFVILVVFFIARLTSFPEMTKWPLTAQTLPAWMTPWFQIIFLKLGVLGAFLVLWIGQLAPQFIANKNPHGFLNIPGMSIFLNVSLLVESLGFTRPGDWLAAPSKEGAAIPISAQEGYRQAVEDLQGYGTLGLKKVWQIEQGKAVLRYQNSLVFKRYGFDKIIDDGLEIKGESPKPRFSCLLFNSNGAEPGRVIRAEKVQDERLDDGWIKFRQGLELNWGSFLPGDVILTESEVTFRSASADGIKISKPTKYLIFRIYFVGDPEKIGTAKVSIYKMDEAISDYDPISEEELPLKYSEGAPYVEYYVFYPPVNSYYYFTWHAEHS